MEGLPSTGRAGLSRERRTFPEEPQPIGLACQAPKSTLPKLPHSRLLIALLVVLQLLEVKKHSCTTLSGSHCSGEEKPHRLTGSAMGHDLQAHLAAHLSQA